MTEGLDGFPEVRSNGHRLVWTAVPPSGRSPGGVVVGRVSVEQEPSLPSWWPRRDRSPGTRAEGWGCSGRDRLPLWTELSAEIGQTSRTRYPGWGCGKPLSRWPSAAGRREEWRDAGGEATRPEARSLRQLEPTIF